MSTILLSSKEMIPEIREYARNFFKKDIRTYVVKQGEKFKVESPWHDADYNVYTCWKLLPDNHAELTGEEVHKTGSDSAPYYHEKTTDKMEVKEGYLVVFVGIYPKRCEIYTAVNAVKMLTTNEIEISDEELIYLNCCKCCTSSYRKTFNTPQHIINSLINKNLLHKNGALSKEGKMFLLSNSERVRQL